MAASASNAPSRHALALSATCAGGADGGAENVDSGMARAARAGTAAEQRRARCRGTACDAACGVNSRLRKREVHTRARGAPAAAPAPARRRATVHFAAWLRTQRLRQTSRYGARWSCWPAVPAGKVGSQAAACARSSTRIRRGVLAVPRTLPYLAKASGGDRVPCPTGASLRAPKMAPAVTRASLFASRRAAGRGGRATCTRGVHAT